MTGRSDRRNAPADENFCLGHACPIEKLPGHHTHAAGVGKRGNRQEFARAMLPAWRDEPAEFFFGKNFAVAPPDMQAHLCTAEPAQEFQPCHNSGRMWAAKRHGIPAVTPEGPNASRIRLWRRVNQVRTSEVLPEPETDGVSIRNWNHPFFESEPLRLKAFATHREGGCQLRRAKIKLDSGGWRIPLI